MREPYLQSHVRLRYRGHVTNKKKSYISTFKAYGPQPQQRADLGRADPSHKVTWHRPHDKSKTLYLRIHKAHSTQNLTGWFRLREPHPKSHKWDETRHHADSNINILLTRNLHTDPSVRQWSHPLMIPLHYLWAIDVTLPSLDKLEPFTYLYFPSS